jgi:hypothetical protein
MILKIFKFCKDLLLVTGVLRLFSPFNKLFLFICNFNRLRSWIGQNKTGLILNDFYTPTRDYNKRFHLYETVINHFGLDKASILYLEFGVASASSFKWWVNRVKDENAYFVGFDTFEGLPEDWGGFYKKGDMYGSVPDLNDKRTLFVKGIFQDTLNDFIEKHKEPLNTKRKVIHMDADLFSATIFTLSQLYPYLQKGDIIFFDEFNVATHEFFAFKIFTEAFYVKMKPVAAINNYYQMAFIVE